MEEKIMHQKLMDECYQMWQENTDLSYANFLTTIIENFGKLHFEAVITGNLNNQVNNGGFIQWFDNGYHITLDELIEFFTKKFNDDKTIKQLLDILEYAWESIEWYERGRKLLKNTNYDWSEYQEIFLDALHEELCKSLDRLNSKYYSMSDKIIEILDQYFTTEKEGETTICASPESQSVITFNN